MDARITVSAETAAQAALFKVLGDPTRLALMKILLRRKFCVQALAGVLGVSESAVSQQMKILKNAGLVSVERYGKHIHFVADRARLDSLGAILESICNMPLLGDGECHCPKESHDCRCMHTEVSKIGTI